MYQQGEGEFFPRITLNGRILSAAIQIAEILARRPTEDETALRAMEEKYRAVRARGSLYLEDNELSEEDFSRLAGTLDTSCLSPEEREAANAMNAYAQMDKLCPDSMESLLLAHGLLTHGLLRDAGALRAGSVAIYQGSVLIHKGLPARQVRQAMEEMFSWLKETDLPPLIAACAFHYQLEWIHPFTDGNGPLGRLWQELILKKWNPVFQYLPVEKALGENRRGYLNALIRADNAGECGEFVAFMLETILKVLQDAEFAGRARLSGKKTGKITGKKASEPREETDDQLLRLLLASPNSTQDELAARMEKSPRTVRAMMQRLQAAGAIRREGARKNGAWVVNMEYDSQGENHADP